MQKELPAVSRGRNTLRMPTARNEYWAWDRNERREDLVNRKEDIEQAASIMAMLTNAQRFGEDTRA